ncbi:tetratricopeptide repeat-containing sensor histidine kinase [Limnovirga soli]|uniref:histidine kinase n=1 Tax=Limnovirga soli TaxID=2656915 RepID=A0A8J8JUC4_9BACT|nr:histidine kinase [Limnovirga soli]NNV56883.1 hypothetical protein [Limnovirga soli]
MIYKSCLILMCCLCFAMGISAQQNQLQQDDQSAQHISAYIKNCFNTADEFMDAEQYDSAQIWLNKIHALLPVKNISLDNYFLLTRQAEVYYYNNLQQLGLQESRRGLAMAEALNDSILLADSYNFIGLFFMNIDSAAQSVKVFNKGLRFTKQPPNPKQYISLSKPHHLHGNLAEAYFKLGHFDSASYHYYLSLQKAAAINWHRGIAVAHSGLGDVFFALHSIDSALMHYTEGANTAIASNDIDVALICYGGMAKCFHAMQQYSSVLTNLDAGFDLLTRQPNINRFYALVFLNTAIDIYTTEKELHRLVAALELKSKIGKENIDDNNRQLQTILNASMQNEKRILTLQVSEAERKQELANTRLILALIGFTFLAIGFLVYRYFQNQKLAVSKIRQKISQDLHDDIGASLSSLQIYGAIAEKTLTEDPDKAMKMIKKISDQSKQVMENMNDIVWSMKPHAMATVSLEAKIKNYGVELLSDKNILLHYHIAAGIEHHLKDMIARKNILLIIKEAMNNIAKYSKATEAYLELSVINGNCILNITDNGVGFNRTTITPGNGLMNMERRALELKGKLSIESTAGQGTIIRSIFPV